MSSEKEKRILNEMCGKGYIPTNDVLKEVERQSKTIRQIILNLYESIPKETNLVENQRQREELNANHEEASRRIERGGK